MTDETISHDRAFGRLEGRVSAIEREYRDDRAANKIVFDEMKASLTEIKNTLHASALADAALSGRFKGGWMVLTSVGAALATIGGLAIMGLKYLFFKG